MAQTCDNIVDGWKSFFINLTSFIKECERHKETNSIDKANYFCEALERYIRSIGHLLATVMDALLCPQVHNANGVGMSGFVELALLLERLVNVLRDFWLPYWRCREETLESTSPMCLPELINHVQMLRTGKRGRPQFSIDKEQLEFLVQLQLSWTNIANLYGINRRTLYRKRVELGIPDKYSLLTDEELLLEVSTIKDEMPQAGEKLLAGILSSQGIHVPRRRIREALHEVDPINTALRWAPRIKRRTYSVAGANALWHLDGNHKLVRWRMVIHGAIDGHSRMILYLHCANNNHSATVLSCFEKAVHDYELPHRIRIDRGGENIEIARFMLHARGVESKPVLTGSSVHNQRIERLWRDVFTAVTGNYYRLFYLMEREGVLDHLSQLDLYALHQVYIPRINRALLIFKNGWNCQKLRTTGKSPNELYASSIITTMTSADDVDECYGVDEDGPVPLEVDTVDIPPIEVDLEEGMLDLLSAVDSCQPSDSFGVDIYRRVCGILGHR